MKVNLSTIGSGYGATSALNANFDAIEAAIENTLSRDGTTPNEMEANLDMNDNNILNVGALDVASLTINGTPVQPSTGVTVASAFQSYTFTATAGQTSFSVSPFTPYVASVQVEVNGLSLPPAEISVSGTNVVIPACSAGDEVVIRRYTDAPSPFPVASDISFNQAGTIQTRTVQSKLRDVVSVKDFGAVGDGVTDDTAAFIAAAATGKQLHIPYGDYVISSPVTISGYLTGEGSDDGQTTITLTGTGQLIVGDWHAHWNGFFIRSAVNSKKFIVVPGISYFKCTNFRAEKIGTATGQIAIEFDTTTASVYFNNIDNFKIKVDYPFNIIGNNTQVFNANKIGTVATGYYQNFLSAIAVSGVIACDANQFAGYLEVGTNAVNHTAGAFRQNRLHFVLDAVTRAYNTSVTVTDQNIWEILDGGFTTGGTYPQNQILIGPPSTKVRATNATADSIPNASVTVLKFDTEVYDTLSEFSNGSGIFTAKNAGYYYIDASALSASVAWDAGERWEIRVYKNGIEYAKGDWNAADAATTRQRGSRVSTTVYMNGTTDTVDVRVIHNQGGTVALDTSPTGNYIDIARLA